VEINGITGGICWLFIWVFVATTAPMEARTVLLSIFAGSNGHDRTATMSSVFSAPTTQQQPTVDFWN
jgi:hypothetical protein